MAGQGSLQMHLDIDLGWQKALLTGRIAGRHQTQTLVDRSQEPQILEAKRQYRLELLNQLRTKAKSGFDRAAESNERDGHPISSEVTKLAVDKVVQRFLNLAETLHTSKAVAVHFTPRGLDALNEPQVRTWINLRVEPNPCPTIGTGLLHPLLIALLAYCMGGPINAADTAHSHSWIAPQTVATEEQCFHIEGGCGDFFNDHKITLVWEVVDGSAKAVSGNHTVFLPEDANPRPLIKLNMPVEAEPMTIIYNSREATLYYDCSSATAKRESVTLEFHLNAISNDVLHLFGRAHNHEADLENLTLAKLVTKFPIMDYNIHFNRLLFSDISLSGIIEKLIQIPVPAPIAAQDPASCYLQERLDKYVKDNRDNIPALVRHNDREVSMSGTYNSHGTFMNNVWLKACRELHSPLGVDLMPQSPIEEMGERARKLIRDLNEVSMAVKLANYKSALQGPFTVYDLLPTAKLYSIAKLIERRCFELVGVGFVADNAMLPSMAAFAKSLGKALDGPKEVRINPEPRVSIIDLQVFGARCLYLFWCSDWMARYLVDPKAGPCMTHDTRTLDKPMTKARLEINQVASQLLKNWVAWGMLTEQLPQGEFLVQRPFEEPFPQRR